MSGAGDMDDDLREYYESAPAGRAIVETVELRHPAFVDGNGNPTAVRIAGDGDDFVATLEADAPLNGGEAVTFIGCYFDAQMPESTDNGLPQGRIAVDNVSRLVMPYILLAAASDQPVEFTYREYRADDAGTPGRVISDLVIGDFEVNVSKASFSIGYDDDINAPFPRQSYTTTEFFDLAQ